MNQADRAKYFRELHTMRPLVLPNAWDAASARIIERAGAVAIATTSAGVSWSLGYSDGQKLRRDEMLDAIHHIARVVSVPVSADIESGYGSGSVHDISEIVNALVEMGVVGINLEDSPGREEQTLLEPGVHAERIHAAREAASAAGGDLVINARTDVYLLEDGALDERFDAVVRRANIYRAAGADCLFVPGVIDRTTIAALVEAIDGPVNIMAMPGAPSISQLGQFGVARVSVGPALARAAFATTRRAACELIQQGSYETLKDSESVGDINGLFSDRRVHPGGQCICRPASTCTCT